MENCHHEMTDKELAQAVACENDVRMAFDEIVRRYCRPLTLFVMGRTGSVQDAEDIVQETFLRAFKNIVSFDSKYALQNWLFTIAYRLIVSEYRKKRPQQLSDKAAAQLTADKSNAQNNQWVWQAAGRLGPEAFTVLWLYYKQEMTAAEIADVMNKTTIMVRVLLHRARKRLARQITLKTESNEQLHWIRGQTVILERAK